MLWVTCCADGTRPFRGVCYNPQKTITPNVKMAMAAIRSARANTSLDIAVMYDGDAPEFLDFLKSHDVRCIQQQFSFADDPLFYPSNAQPSSSWTATAHRELLSRLFGVGTPQQVATVCQHGAWTATTRCGTWMRVDLFSMFPEQDYVLYTDTDVIFNRDPGPLLEHVRPKFIAGVSYGSESAFPPEKPLRAPAQGAGAINAGVLLVNVKAWREELDAFVETARSVGWGAGEVAYGINECVFNLHFKDRIQYLRRTFNWRPLWGVFKAAPIVHYSWGCKPGALKELLEWGWDSPDLPGHCVSLWRRTASPAAPWQVPMTRDTAQYYVDLYEKYS